MHDESNESRTNSEEKVTKFSSEHLKFTMAPKDTERAHRLGTFPPNKTRPVLAKFTRLKDKEKILNASKDNKHRKVYVAQDFSPGP